MNLEFKRKLPTLQEIKAMYPIDEQLASQKKARDVALKDIFEGKDDRLVLVIGPCSADREDAVLDYISRRAREGEGQNLYRSAYIYQQAAYHGRRLQGYVASTRSACKRKHAQRAYRNPQTAYKSVA